MILKTLLTLKTLLPMAVESLQLIDLDRGQLEEPTAFESLVFPCLLVSAPIIDWSELTQGDQTGDLSFITKTIVQLPNNIAFYSAANPDGYGILQAENEAVLEIEDDIHQAIIAGISCYRSKTREYPMILEGSPVWVTEHTYEQGVQYHNTPKYTRKTTPTGTGIQVILDRHGYDDQ